MRTTTSTLPYALSLTITGTSGTISHTASTTLLVNLAPPTGLTATAGDAQVSLSWQASVGANSYHVKRAEIDGGPYETFACPSGTTFVDSGLINGTTYYYTVSAAYTGGPDQGGESANSVQASATPQGGTPSLPAPPTGLKARSNKPGTIDLQWVQSPTPGVTSNGVYRRLMNGGTYPTSPTYTINPANTSFRDSQVSRGVSYCYKVTAINANGQSGPSNESCATPK
jgi:cellulose 1,4-beta-cellobiosidase